MRVIITWIKCARLTKEIRGDSWVELEGRIRIPKGWICNIRCMLISVLRVGHDSFKLFSCSRSHESTLKPMLTRRLSIPGRDYKVSNSALLWSRSWSMTPLKNRGKCPRAAMHVGNGKKLIKMHSISKCLRLLGMSEVENPCILVLLRTSCAD